MQVRGLLDDAEALDGNRRSNDPADAQTRKGNLGEAVDMNDDVGTVELLERRNSLVAGMQTRVNVILDDGNLVTRSELKNLAARGERHRDAGGILKVWREQNELDAIGGKRGFESFEIDAEQSSGLRSRAHWNTQAANACTVEDSEGAGIGRILEDDGIAWTQEGLTNEVEGLLAAVGDQEVLVADEHAFAP